MDQDPSLHHTPSPLHKDLENYARLQKFPKKTSNLEMPVKNIEPSKFEDPPFTDTYLLSSTNSHL